LAPTPEITGAVLSVTLMVWLAVDTFPDRSVAVQVLVIEYLLAQFPLMDTSEYVRLADPQASDALGLLKAGAEGQEITEFAPTPVMIGAL